MFDELETEIEVTLRLLKLNYKKIYLKKNFCAQFFIEDFGMVICCMERKRYREIKDLMENNYSGWRAVYLAVGEEVKEEKENIIWELARGGYFKWVRLNYPRQFNNFIIMEGFGKKIIKERLRIWAGREKYRFLIADNEDALRNSETYILSTEPSFYDYIPEEL
jgi:hypothetical protein